MAPNNTAYISFAFIMLKYSPLSNLSLPAIAERRDSRVPDVGNCAVACNCTGLAAKLRERGEVQHKKEGHEVDGNQSQGKNGHQIACRLNLKCVPRRRSQETEPKRISEIEKTKHVPRRNKTYGLVRRSRISNTHNGCQEAYDGVAQASG